MIYLDNAATTFPKPEAVYHEMDHFSREGAVNAGRGGYKAAKYASAVIESTKDKIRQLINSDKLSPVIFSPSITIALNQVISGYEWKNNAVVYVSPFEHNAVARTLNYLKKQSDIDIEELPLDENRLMIDIEKTKVLFSQKHPTAVFCTHISNVTGYILPVQKIFGEAKRYGAFTVLDTAQSLGLIPVDSRTMNADVIAFAGHKTLYGPLGIGGFVNIAETPLKEMIVGGTGSDSLNLDMPQNNESKYEAASSNILAIIGLKAALEVINQNENYCKEKQLTEYLIKKLNQNSDVKLYLPEDLSEHIGVVSFSVQGYMSSDVGMILDEDYDIAVRTGYHCAPFIHKYLKDEKTMGTVRVGISQYTMVDDIDRLVEALDEIVGG